MFKVKEKWGPIETVGDLIREVNDIGDVDPETPLECFGASPSYLKLMSSIETGEQYLEIDS